jgi:tetratricopeptide (TPR) repeat protein
MTLYPDLFQPHNNSGRILAQLGRYSEAAAEFEKAHALDPRHTAPLWNLWELRLNRLDDPAGAEAHARTLGELQPDNAWIRHLVAWTDVALRRFDRAEQGMREVLSSLPLHPLASANLGHLLLRRGAVDDAVEIYADVLKQARAGVLDMSPSNSALFLGLALAADGRAAEARLVYAAEITGLTTPGRPSSVFDAGQLASLYAAAGERQQAERFARRVMEAQPAAPGVLYVLARTRALLGDQGGAADLLRKARAAGYDQPYFVLIDPALRSLQNHPVIEEIAVPERSRGLR